MRTGVVGLVIGLVTVAALSGCGFLQEMADPPVTPPPPLVAPTPEATPPPASPVLTAQLLDDRTLPGGPFRGDLRVAAHPVAAGLPRLDSSFPADCGYDAATARHLAVDLTFTNRSTATAVVSAAISVTGPGVDADAVGLFVDSTDPDVRYCQDGDRTPSVDHLVLGANGPTVVSVELLVGAGAPDDALTGLTVALTDLRDPVAGGSNQEGAWAVSRGPLTSCLDGPGGLCVSVG
jgi:hypothetical protein